MQGPGPDCNSYYHELFLRGRPELTQLMTRLINPGKRSHDSDEEPNFYDIAKRFPLPEVTYDDDDLIGGHEMVPAEPEPNASLAYFNDPFTRVELTSNDRYVSDEREAKRRRKERYSYASNSSVYHPEYANGHPGDLRGYWHHSYRQNLGNTLGPYSYYERQANQNHSSDPHNMYLGYRENNVQSHQEHGYNNAQARTNHAAYANHEENSQRANPWELYASRSNSSSNTQAMNYYRSFEEDITQSSNSHFLDTMSPGENSWSSTFPDEKGQEKKSVFSSYGLQPTSNEDTIHENETVDLLQLSTYNNEPYWL